MTASKYIYLKNYELVNSQDEIVGKILTSNKSGEYRVNGQTTLKTKNGEILYECEFIKTKFKGLFKKCHIITGGIRDPLHNHVYGVASSGGIDSTHFLYKRWQAMISRCYNKKCADYRFYGERGITVCERWLLFGNFIEDAIKIPGYDKKLIEEGKLEIDKDARGIKQYSLSGALWVPSKLNKDMSIQQQIDNLKEFIGIRLEDGYVEHGKSKKAFAEKHDLQRRCITKCLLGEQKSHKGWKFEFADKEAKS